jgi:hypothetical protein
MGSAWDRALRLALSARQMAGAAVNNVRITSRAPACAPEVRWLMAVDHSALESLLSARILLPFCCHFCHTLARLETKVGESVLKSPSLKWKKKEEFPWFCCFFEFDPTESRYRYHSAETPGKSPETGNCCQHCYHFSQMARLNFQNAEYYPLRMKRWHSPGEHVKSGEPRRDGGVQGELAW